MSYRIVTRSEIGLPSVVRSSSGALRPALVRPVPMMGFHYAGIRDSLILRDDRAQVLKTEEVATAAGKPFEYNYMIGRGVTDEVYEVGGLFRAAHSSGNNDTCIGVQFMLGVHREGDRRDGKIVGFEPPTDLMVDKFRWLRHELAELGVFSPAVVILPHRELPGAATLCPGEAVIARRADLVEIWSPPPTPPPPSPPAPPPAPVPTPAPPVLEAPTMLVLDWHPEENQAGGRWTSFVWTGTHLSHLGGAADNLLRRTPAVRRETVNDPELESVIAASVTIGPAPGTLPPVIRSAWARRAIVT